MKILDHAVLLMNMILYLCKVLGNLPIILLLLPIDLLLQPLSIGQNALYRIVHHKILPRIQPQHRLLVSTLHCLLLVAAIIGKVSNRRKSAVAHGARILLPEIVRRGFPFVLQMTEGRLSSILRMRLQPHAELP